MYDLKASFGASPHAVDKPADADTVLITEQQMLFATAAAMPLRPSAPSRRLGGLGVIMGAALSVTSNVGQPRRRHYPSRMNFLEDSRMTREMLRL